MNAGSLPRHVPLPPTLPAPPEPPALVELCSVTSLTPSIRRRRSSVCATSVWLVAHPLRVKIGTLPGGVAEVTPAPAFAPEAPALAAAPVVEEAEPIVPLSEEIEAPGGQHATELVEGVGPVEARVHELRDGLHALFAQRQEAGVGRQLPCRGLGALRLAGKRCGLRAAA